MSVADKLTDDEIRKSTFEATIEGKMAGVRPVFGPYGLALHVPDSARYVGSSYSFQASKRDMQRCGRIARESDIRDQRVAAEPAGAEISP